MRTVTFGMMLAVGLIGGLAPTGASAGAPPTVADAGTATKADLARALAVLDDPQASITATTSAVASLSKLGAPAVRPLIKRLHSRDARLRGRAAQALAGMEHGVAAPALRDLTRALRDRDAAVRYNAAIALGRLGPRARPALKAALARLGPDEEDQYEAIQRALADIEAHRGAPASRK